MIVIFSFLIREDGPESAEPTIRTEPTTSTLEFQPTRSHDFAMKLMINEMIIMGKQIKVTSKRNKAEVTFTKSFSYYKHLKFSLIRSPNSNEKEVKENTKESN